MHFSLCPHEMNASSCPDCYKRRPPNAKPAQPGTRPDVPLGPVMAIGEATMRATQVRAANVPSAAPNGRVFKEPYTERGLPPEAFREDKIWEPPPRRQLIDAQPKHPHVQSSNLQVLKR